MSYIRNFSNGVNYNIYKILILILYFKIQIFVKKNFYDCVERHVNPKYFDGQVSIKEVFDEKNSQDQELYFVEFSDGALTTIHFHETEQILIPYYGKGIIGKLKKNDVLNFEIEDIELNVLNEGDIVATPSDVLHFHGALPKQNFTHIAFRKLVDYECKNNEKISYLTQTRWIYDFIADRLGNEDSNIVNSELQKISNKVHSSIRKYISKL